MAKVSFINVSKRFGATSIIENLQLEVNDKEFVVIVGPSGCGKSTTLRMLAGLDSITEGEIRIDDRVVNNVPPKDRNIAMVFQSYALYPHMNVYNNMAFGLKLRKVPKAEIDQRVRSAAEMLGLTSMLNRKPRALSGGQRQRVAVGRAIVRKPDVFLMDEPLSNLDAKLRVSARTEINRLHKSLQTTFIYVTHDQVEAMTLGDRLVVMNEGKVSQFDTPKNVYQYPADTFVAQFIGSPSMNLYNGDLIMDNETLKFMFSQISIDLPKSLLSTSVRERIGQPITLGIRPEYIYVQGYEPQNTQGLSPVNANLQISELLGHQIHLTVDIGNYTSIATVDSSFNMRAGSNLVLLFDTDKIHLFDHKTGTII